MSTIASNVTLDALFRRNATLRGDLRALHDLDGTSLSYTETANAVAHVTEQIAALGLPANSTIALLLPNGRELIVATLAVMRSGHLVVPMPVAWRKSDLVRACREAEVAALITTANFAPVMRSKYVTSSFAISLVASEARAETMIRCRALPSAASGSVAAWSVWLLEKQVAITITVRTILRDMPCIPIRKKIDPR